MALHLVTGYAGEAHITSADQGAYNMGTFGEGEFVLDRGSKFGATIVSNNSITIADGEAIMQGRFIKIPVGTTEAVTIDNGTQGMNRKDLICLHYEKDSSIGVESVSLVVKKGTESSGTPADPSYTTGDITDGNDLVNEMPLYRVNLTGLTISSVDTLFSLKTSMVDYMDNYQLPIASGSQLGGVKIGSGISLASDGKISVPAYTLPIAGNNTLGGVKIKLDAGIRLESDGKISLKKLQSTAYSCSAYDSMTLPNGNFYAQEKRFSYPSDSYIAQKFKNADYLLVKQIVGNLGLSGYYIWGNAFALEDYIYADFFGYNSGSSLNLTSVIIYALCFSSI